MDKAEIKKKDHKVPFILLAIGIVVITIAATAIFITQTRANQSPQLSPITKEDAKALAATERCFANDPTIKSQVVAQPHLSEDAGPWTSYIYDVPAGTNVDVNIATYTDASKITGSLAYSEPYGSYNFSIEKQGEEWRYTHFTGCYK